MSPGGSYWNRYRSTQKWTDPLLVIGTVPIEFWVRNDMLWMGKVNDDLAFNSESDHRRFLLEPILEYPEVARSVVSHQHYVFEILNHEL